MPIKSVEQLKSWFRRGMYPTEQNFSDLIDSFYHRDSKLPISAVENLSEKLDANNDLIPIDLRFGGMDETKNNKYILLCGNIPQGYVPVVFRKIRRNTRHSSTGKEDVVFQSPAQWIFYGEAVLDPYSQDAHVNRIGFHGLRNIKARKPYKDHNKEPEKKSDGSSKVYSTADEFVLVHNVDTDHVNGGEKNYPQTFDLRVAWGAGGSKKRRIFVDKGIGQPDMKLAAITLHLGIGLIKKELLGHPSRLISLDKLSSNLATFKIVHDTSLNDVEIGKRYRHDYKPSFCFTR